MSPRSLDDRLRAARPVDPVGMDLRAASVRVIARLAMLEAGARSTEQEKGDGRTHAGWRVAQVAACLALVFLATRAGRPLATRPVESVAVVDVPPDPFAGQVEAALGGDLLARRRLAASGPRGRAALLDHAAQDGGTFAGALELLRAGGGIRSDVEAERLGMLAADPRSREMAIELLATAPITAGVEQLGRLLLDLPEAESEIVDGLLVASRRGRRGSVLPALVRGAARGRVEAAAAAIRSGSVRTADAALDALPRRLRTNERIVAACRGAAPTLRNRLVRRAAAGDDSLLELAALARLDGVVAVLDVRATTGDVEAARAAVAALADQGRPEAWLAITRALSGPAFQEARAVLATAPRAAVSHLARVARTEPRRRDLALAGLAVAGRRGLDALAGLASRPAFHAPVIAVLQGSATSGAVGVLADLATGGRDEGRAVVALSRRLERGDREAGTALLTLVQEHESRQALRLLARHGAAAGLDWFTRVANRSALSRSARATLRRALRRAQAAEGALPQTAGRRPGVVPIT